MKKYISELIGTFALVFLGSGAYILAGNSIGQFGVALVFGLAVVAVYGAIHRVSGAHINPAVTLGALVNGRISGLDSIYYIISQLLGSLLGALAVYALALGNLGYNLTYGLGQNGFGDASLGAYPWWAALVFELIATFLFVYIFLGATEKKKDRAVAGIAIGLFFAAAYMVGLQIGGASLNPARSFGPAVITGLGASDKNALIQLPLFLLVPAIGGLLAGLAYKFNQSDDEYEAEEDVEIEVLAQ